ncbi:ABC transporter substrate-binding protein [Microbacterium sediminis]|uniref:Thiamine biosynthesis protein n=1 Tax=Microbacterium sediminis TaxID=904291 RepID=A0A1B9N9N4_9MICO|nr:ABC transporter substrate-binding protein [Microbacterium sediminis]OCG73303.1 thiamine biosynthesis protein [Microbacterium sediminis]QBR75198.1 transporter substrate-binding domain-containing protein [Microbacterium sediminis]
MARFRIAATIGALAAAGLLLASCSSGSPSGGAPSESAGGGSEELTPITVGLLTIAPSAAVEYGIQNGIFEEHGLDVETSIAQGGAAMLPAVSTGQIDFGVGNPLSVLTAASQGIDVRITSGYSFSLEEGDDINAVVAKADSGITTWADLEGKTVSVNAVNTQGDLTIKDSVAQDGGDPDAVNFSEIAFPDALAQLDAGNVDAVWIPEPFLGGALTQPEEYTVVGYPNQNSLPGLPTMVTFASGAVVEDTETLEKWRSAITDVLETVNGDPEGFAAVIAEFTGMPEATALELRLERLSGELDPQVITDLSALAAEYGFIESEPDLDVVIAE